jgi:hypothetical protein
MGAIPLPAMETRHLRTKERGRPKLVAILGSPKGPWSVHLGLGRPVFYVKRTVSGLASF